MSFPLLAELSILDLWWSAWMVWFFALGACVGSFLNVAVYRLPAGLNVAYPRSRCPKCGTGIRWYDNVPILSWFVLGGQCRDCGLPIGLRYPFVELVGGVVFVLLLWFEAFTNGGNVPTRYVGVVADFTEGGYRFNHGNVLEVMLGFHLLLMATLLAAALIDFDGHPQPLVLYFPAWIVGLLLPLWYPLIRPEPWDSRLMSYMIYEPWWDRNTPLAAIYDSLPAVGFLILATLLSGIVGLIPGGNHLFARLPSWGPVATVLLFLGWQATLVAAVGAMIVYPVLWLCGTRITWNGCLFLTTLVALLTWGSWDGLLPRGDRPSLLHPVAHKMPTDGVAIPRI